MKSIVLKILLILLTCNLAFSQTYIGTNVDLVTERHFENLENDKLYEWLGDDGNYYAIKTRNNEKYTGIKLNGKWVRHGVYFKYSKSSDKPEIKFLEVESHYRFGALHGESKRFKLIEGKRFLAEVINYNNGIKHGKYIDYDGKEVVYRKGEYNYGLKSGTWTNYYFDSVSPLYEYVYNDCDCTRYEYAKDDKAVKNHKKGRLKSEFPMKVKITNFERLSTYEVTHGVIKYYIEDGTINKIDKFHDNIGPILDGCNRALEIRNMLTDPKAHTRQTAYEIYKFVFGEAKANNLGVLTQEDIDFANEIYNNLMSHNCHMKYVKSLALSSLIPTRSIDGILEAIIDANIEGCSKRDITQIMNTWVNYHSTPHLRVRLGVSND
ncbi:hypothetical protein [Winogradskyella psychrotolerans]|uniref:hypothetical protein n=1 Tax=Winogradskyella psychrotolerans TaxID=1344585 RepID=UPI001C07BC86|nr:hypothetical protein [Winogradskyella psychrotolerans]MBU2928872.1 hypothetical protein [Winogradskyella psychrotolerans]